MAVWHSRNWRNKPGYPNSTTHRLLTTMQQQGWCVRLANWDTGQSAHMPLWSAAAFSRAVIC
ncbi:helix-turn-helix domain-containing protein [Escherichia coli]